MYNLHNQWVTPLLKITMKEGRCYMVKDANTEMLFCDMIRLMADNLKQSVEKTVLKTTTINRVTLKKLIEYIAVHESLKEIDVAENVGISGRFLSNIKNDKEPVYISIRVVTIERVVQYVYDLAEHIELQNQIEI